MSCGWPGTKPSPAQSSELVQITHVHVLWLSVWTAALLTMVMHVMFRSWARRESICACGLILCQSGSSQVVLGVVRRWRIKRLLEGTGMDWTSPGIGRSTWMCWVVCVNVTGTVLVGCMARLALVEKVIQPRLRCVGWYACHVVLSLEWNRTCCRGQICHCQV